MRVLASGNAPGDALFLRSNATGSQPKATAAVATDRASSVTGLVRGSPSDCTRGRRGGGAAPLPRGNFAHNRSPSLNTSGFVGSFFQVAPELG